LASAGKAAVGYGNDAAVFGPDKKLETEGIFMNTRTKLAIAVSAALWMVPMTRAVAGIDIEAGDWKIDFSGNVNAFYVNAQCDDGVNTAVVGGLACTGDRSAAVRNGLLPAALVFSATTRQDNFDLDVTVGFYPGINSTAAAGVNGPGLPAALQTPGIDARQVYFTFGDASWGTVKMGRDIGLFGKDAILDDMTLLGVGTASAGNVAPSNTSLGRIGIGYIYTDWQPQITYTTATYSGFSGSVGIFQPLDASGAGPGSYPGEPADALYSGHDGPQVQVGASYVWGDPKTDTLTGKVWVDFVSQQAKATAANITVNAHGAGTSFTGNGVDGGVKVDFSGFEGVVYGYYGNGIGTTGLYLFPTSSSGDRRESTGGYAQLTYKLDKLKLGISYGLSELKLASDEEAFTNETELLRRNSSGIFGAYYSLTKSLTLVGEFIDSKAQAWGGNSATEKDFALGGILLF
jgi:predicted porin